MRCKFIPVFIFMLVFMLSLVSAINTDLTIWTEPNQNLIVRVMTQSQSTFLSLYPKSNSTGVATANFSTNLDKVSFIVIIVEDGMGTDYKEFGPISTSAPIELEMIEKPIPPEPEETQINQTINQSATTNQTKQTNETSPGITGAAISAEDSTNSSQNHTKYIIIITSILTLIFLIITFKHKSKVYIGAHPLPAQATISPAGVDLRILDAEKKIEQVKKEIDNIKRTELEKIQKQNKLQQAKENFEKAKQELEKQNQC